MDNIISPNELEKTAYHEAGHTVVARLLRRPIKSILLIHTKQAESWVGIASNEVPSDSDSDWAVLSLDQYIPYGEFEFHYSTYPEPYEEYKTVREDCIIKYAGWVSETFLYKQRSFNKIPMPSDESATDFRLARGLLQKYFSPQEWEEELHNAESHARKILSNQLSWSMVENLAKALINKILHGKEPLRQDDHSEMFKFCHEMVYKSFRLTLTKDDA